MSRRAIVEEALAVTDEAGLEVSALLTLPPEPSACYVFAHGAGAGMTHPFMQEVAYRLAERGIATLRYQFPSMERGSKRPDAPAMAHRTVQAAVAAAVRSTGLPLFGGGKSFGGRMTSQAQALAPLENVHGLVFLGFPLHAPDKPSTKRAEHLSNISVPMLFVQGTRDKLAPVSAMRGVTTGLQNRATLLLVADADHGFDVLVRSGRTHEDIMQQIADGVSAWIGAILPARPTGRSNDDGAA